MTRPLRGRRLIGLVLWAVALPVPLLAEELALRLVGNAAIEITDGKTTLLTDFPYESGAYGYMEYPDGELAAREDSICLITHSHTDHFAPELVDRVGCRVLAHSSVQALVPPARRLPWDGRRFEVGSLSVTAVPTSHMDGHLSYLIDWSGTRLWFTGDTNSVDELLAADPVDILFVTPWLAESLGADSLESAARRVVIYHHRGDEDLSFCPHCEVPARGAPVSAVD